MSKNGQILLVDDDSSICQIVKRILEDNNYNVAEAHSGKEALSLCSDNEIDLVLLDLQLPDQSGIEVATAMIAHNPLIPIVLISAYGTISKAVEATKLGVFDFLEKPLERDRILVTVRNALAQGQLKKDLSYYKNYSLARFQMIGRSPEIQQVYAQIEKIAPTNSSVLILGENGVGKELVAQAIHASSPRTKKPFVKMNCAAVPDDLLESELFGHTKGAFTGAFVAKKGRVQMADGGTLFLDEIGDMSASAQAKILRFLESGEIQRVGASEISKVDVRVIAASNKNLKQMVQERTFREDLYYRLNVFTIIVPPLRERRTDIPLLLDHFITKHVEDNGVIKPILSPAAINYLSGYDWQGNIRQLHNFVERMMTMRQDDFIDLNEVIPLLETKESPISSQPYESKSLTEARDSFEREFIIKTLNENNWKVAKAAEALNMDRANLYRKMRQLGIGLE